MHGFSFKLKDIWKSVISDFVAYLQHIVNIYLKQPDHCFCHIKDYFGNNIALNIFENGNLIIINNLYRKRKHIVVKNSTIYWVHLNVSIFDWHYIDFTLPYLQVFLLSVRTKSTKSGNDTSVSVVWIILFWSFILLLSFILFWNAETNLK